MDNTRSEKGNSLITLPSSYTIIDIITTGHDYYYDDIIEIAALKVVDNKKTDFFCSFVKRSYVNNFITETTGITTEMVQDAPTLETVLVQFFNFIQDDILVGHVVNFDINFIYDRALKCLGKPLKNDFVDTLRIARKLINLKHHKLSSLIEYFGLEPRIKSRAENGCSSEFEVYNRLKDIAEQMDDYKSLWKKHIKNKPIKAKDLKPTTFEIDIDNPLYGRTCVFTGALERMTRKNAMQIVLNIGGLVGDTVTRKTNYLIIGNYDYCKSIKDGKSTKHKKAEQLKLSGQDIEIISESVFYDMILDEV